MNLEIYKEEKKEYDKIKLALKKTPDGIDVVVVDRNGKTEESGFLLNIKNDGTVRRYPHMDRDFGFKSDEGGKIKLSE